MLIRSARQIFVLLLCAVCVACAESDFRLASDSRLPRWFSLPAGLKRSDVTVRITYYIPGGPRIQLIGPGGSVIASVRGTDRWDPDSERRATRGEYPTYSFIKVGEVEEVIEHRSPGPILYIAERVASSESDRVAVLRLELQNKLQQRGTEEAADFKELTELALQAKEYGTASSLASERLRFLQTHDCKCYDDTHRANIVLGLAAVRQGDVARAKQYLAAAGRVGSSPVLSSFGPNMQLAEELLQEGERDAVLAYLQDCAAFWTSGRKDLDKWAGQIRRGEVPDFGANVLSLTAWWTGRNLFHDARRKFSSHPQAKAVHRSCVARRASHAEIDPASASEDWSNGRARDRHADCVRTRSQKVLARRAVRIQDARHAQPTPPPLPDP